MIVNDLCVRPCVVMMFYEIVLHHDRWKKFLHTYTKSSLFMCVTVIRNVWRIHDEHTEKWMRVVYASGTRLKKKKITLVNIDRPVPTFSRNEVRDKFVFYSKHINHRELEYTWCTHLFSLIHDRRLRPTPEFLFFSTAVRSCLSQSENRIY